jgi:predicted DNA-binding transcriptional regulator YafY
VLEALSRAAAAGRRLWIGYTDTDGRQGGRIIAPSSVDGGFVTAHDETRGAVQRFAVHRITAVAELEEDDRGATP